MKLSVIRLLVAGLALPVIAACSAPSEPGAVNDPYERLNRTIHNSNRRTDRYIVRPASQVYGNIPAPVRRSINNVASNLNGPQTIANDLLQGNVEDAGHNLSRFLVNSTIGVLGIFDPASGSFGLEERETGFADTMAVWGIREGAYLELPVVGPSTERDALGLAVDIATNPIGTLVEGGDEIATALFVPTILDTRYVLADTVDSIYESADSYVQLRLFYLESRRFELGGGETSADGTDDTLYDDVYGGLYE